MVIGPVDSRGYNASVGPLSMDGECAHPWTAEVLSEEKKSILISKRKV